MKSFTGGPTAPVRSRANGVARGPRKTGPSTQPTDPGSPLGEMNPPAAVARRSQDRSTRGAGRYGDIGTLTSIS